MAGLRHFALNPKCVVISTALGAFYWYLPPKNWKVLLGILVGSYFGVAWYDELYGVPPDRRLQPGFLSNFVPGYSSLKPKFPQSQTTTPMQYRTRGAGY